MDRCKDCQKYRRDMDKLGFAFVDPRPQKSVMLYKPGSVFTFDYPGLKQCKMCNQRDMELKIYDEGDRYCLMNFGPYNIKLIEHPCDIRDALNEEIMEYFPVNNMQHIINLMGREYDFIIHLADIIFPELSKQTERHLLTNDDRQLRFFSNKQDKIVCIDSLGKVVKFNPIPFMSKAGYIFSYGPYLDGIIIINFENRTAKFEKH